MTFPTETFSPETIRAIELALRIGIIVLALGIVCAVIWSIASRITKGKTRVHQVKVQPNTNHTTQDAKQAEVEP